jgi:hypothetical protein
LVTKRRRLVGGPKIEKTGVATVETYEPYPIKFLLHLGTLVVIHTRIRWASSLHGNTP